MKIGNFLRNVFPRKFNVYILTQEEIEERKKLPHEEWGDIKIFCLCGNTHFVYTRRKKYCFFYHKHVGSHSLPDNLEQYEGNVLQYYARLKSD